MLDGGVFMTRFLSINVSFHDTFGRQHLPCLSKYSHIYMTYNYSTGPFHDACSSYQSITNVSQVAKQRILSFKSIMES